MGEGTREGAWQGGVVERESSREGEWQIEGVAGVHGREGEWGQCNVHYLALTFNMSSMAVEDLVPSMTKPMARPAASPITASSRVIRFSFSRSYTSTYMTAEGGGVSGCG